MKKSCLVAVIATLAAVAGALAAVAVYLHRREKELDEYERLLFGEDNAETVEPAAGSPQRTRQRCRRINQTPKNAPGMSASCGALFLRRTDLKSTSHSPLRRASSPRRGAKCRDAALKRSTYHETFFALARWCGAGRGGAAGRGDGRELFLYHRGRLPGRQRRSSAGRRWKRTAPAGRCRCWAGSWIRYSPAPPPLACRSWACCTRPPGPRPARTGPATPP